MRPKLFITGGTGFLGGHVLTMAKAHWKVFASFRTQHPEVEDVSWVCMHLENTQAIFSILDAIRPDAVIHAGGMTKVDACEMEKEKAYQINVLATESIAKWCKKSHCKLVFVSSDMVFDGEKGNYTEEDSPNPLNWYGKTKSIAEERLLSIHPQSVCARSALIYGKPAVWGSSFSDELIKKFSQGEKVKLFTDQFRTPIYVPNLAQALLELAENSFTGIFHLGGPEKIDRYTFGLRLIEQCGFSPDLIQPIQMNEMPAIAPRPKDASLDISKARTVLKTQFFGIREGLENDQRKE